MAPDHDTGVRTAGDLDSIGIVGGTGPSGIALATRLAAAGQQVAVGSRDVERASAAADVIRRTVGAGGAAAVFGTNKEVARCGIVVLAVNSDHVLAVADEIRDDAGGRIVVSMATLLRRGRRGFTSAGDPNGSGRSLAEAIQSTLPNSRVVAAFHHLPADVLGRLEDSLHVDVLVCGDDGDAVADVITRFDAVTAGRLVDAGPLANAAALEGLTGVLVSINAREGGVWSIALTDLRTAASGPHRR